MWRCATLPLRARIIMLHLCTPAMRLPCSTEWYLQASGRNWIWYCPIYSCWVASDKAPNILDCPAGIVSPNVPDSVFIMDWLRTADSRRSGAAAADATSKRRSGSSATADATRSKKKRKDPVDDVSQICELTDDPLALPVHFETTATAEGGRGVAATKESEDASDEQPSESGDSSGTTGPAAAAAGGGAVEITAASESDSAQDKWQYWNGDAWVQDKGDDILIRCQD
eukprot:GHVU01086869.1.p2 GENE.GHVU01086869.1~~GHVU01086869.1.p2  ORF type:complete len:227 (-),score=38.24 GHVU01086869.1:1153-1833(-)